MELTEIVDIIQSKAVSLFYGAGVSKTCGGPLGGELFDALRKNFKTTESDDFFLYLQELIGDDDTNRSEIEQFIIERLAVISPNESIKYLFSLPWRVILTTNYDHLPDLIDKTLDNNRIITTISDPMISSIDQTKAHNLYCFKILGDVKYQYPNNGWMVLTQRDLRYAYERRTKFIQLFRNLSTSGHIIYLGYSFKDNLVFDFLNEMKHILKRLPWKGFTISPNKPDEKILKRLHKFGITWVKGTLEELNSEARRKLGDIPFSAPSLVKNFTIHNIPIKLDHGTATNIWRKYKLLTNSDLIPFSEDPINFFEGLDNSFYPFVANWDYPRNIKSVYRKHENKRITKLDFDKILNLSKSGNSSNNITMVLRGTAGSGKTVISKRLSFEWYKKGNPVIFIKSDVISIDTQALEGLVDEIWKKYKIEFEKKNKPIKNYRFLIIIDNCSAHFEYLVKLRDLMISIGKPADILLILRKSDLSLDEIRRHDIDIVFEVNDTIHSEELDDFTNHFERFKVLKDSEIIKRNIDNFDINSSFFALTYTSVKGVSKPLREIILDEFNNLDEESRKIYSIVSFLHSLSLTPYFSLCLKCSELEVDNILSKISKGNLSGIINYQSNKFTNNYSKLIGLEYEVESLFTNNKIIADIIYTNVFLTAEQKYSTLKKIISAITLNDDAEVELLHILLIDRLKKGLISGMQKSQKIGLFQEAIKEIKSKPLLHHLAKLQMDSGNYDDAKITLNEAMKTRLKGFDEAKEHILDSMGRLEICFAEQAISEGVVEEAWENLDKAENLFYESMLNPRDTPHPFHGLSKTFILKAELSDDEDVKMMYFLLAIKECAYVESYMNRKLYYQLNDLKLKAIVELEKMDFNEEKAKKILEYLDKGDGFAFLADLEIKKENHDEAMELVNSGLKKDHDSLWLIRQKVYLTRELHPENYYLQLEELRRYFEIANRRFDVMLTFELAIVSFKLEDYSQSIALFRELSKRTKYNPLRVSQIEKNRWLEKGKPKEFYGNLIVPPTTKEYGSIECTSLPNYKNYLTVRKEDIEFEYKEQDRVTFNIIFNMSGPQASRIRKS